MRLSEGARDAVLIVILALFALRAWTIFGLIVAIQPLGVDFLPLWTAARVGLDAPHLLYDFKAITDAQDWLMADFGRLRPYVYPPSTLLVILPFATIPFFWAYGVWTAIGASALAGATAWAARVRGGLAAALVLISPPGALAIMVGQTTLLVAGLLTFAVSELQRRPLLSGALLGVAAAIKPQAALLVPLGLIAARAWRPLLAALVAGSALGLASAPLVGWEPWLAWLTALPLFNSLLEQSPSLMRGGITLTMLGLNLGLEGAALSAWRLAAGACAVVGVWLAFARSDDVPLRLAALAAGALAITPYAMHYEATLLAPPAVMLALSKDRWLFGLTAVAALGLAVRPETGGICVIVAAACATAAALYRWRATKGADSSRS